MDVDEDLEAMLAEQRRELTAAQAADSDLDFAFQLQMEEAIKASAEYASSSASCSSTPQLQLQNDAVSESTLAGFLAEEIERYEQEWRDRLAAEAEMRRILDDVGRRVHDQAFAREVLAVPEVEWLATGAELQKPYGEGSSSSAPAANFRLYTKGLVSEETVEGLKKTVAGIGVAICDESDALLFEVTKRLISSDSNREVVEVKALVEGLNFAHLLGMKKLQIFCADNTIFQYITGKLRPLQSRVATLVDHVALLQRKFTHCNPTLVLLNDTNFAVKLARNAVSSLVAKPVDSIHGKNLVETCAICLEDTNLVQMFSVNGCLHRYCFSCMKQHVEVKLLQGRLPTCPHENCKSVLNADSCKNFLTPEQFDVLQQRIKEDSIPATEKVYCPFPKCSALMSRVEAVPSKEDNMARKCQNCQRLFCISCKVPWHRGMTCVDYKNSNPYPCPEDAKLKNLANRNLWRQCVNCSHMVELASGCYHVYCRCGHEFCYTCGAEWKSKKPTCRCPIWDERNIIYDQTNGNQRRRIG